MLFKMLTHFKNILAWRMDPLILNLDFPISDIQIIEGLVGRVDKSTYLQPYLERLYLNKNKHIPHKLVHNYLRCVQELKDIIL